MNFLAIDFETADSGADSACAIGLVRVSNGEIVAQEHHLIRPPRRDFYFTYIHGISWQDVAGADSFGALWPKIAHHFEDANYLVAHNASFDRRVLGACCEMSKIAPPSREFICTVQVARRVWDIRPTKLPDVCARLGFELNHHEALSDARASARILMAALESGFTL